MPNPLIMALAALGSGNQGYNQGQLDQYAVQAAKLKQQQAQQGQDATGAYLAALQAFVNSQGNNAGPTPLPMAPGQPSVPTTTSMPSPYAAPSGNISAPIQLPPVNDSQLAPNAPSGGGASIPPPPPPANSNLPLTTPLPAPTPVPMPGSSAPAQQAPTQPQTQENDYQGLLKRVVAAVNQAMPTGDPATKSIVAQELMKNVVTQQQQYDLKEQAQAFKQSQLGERERSDLVIEGIRQQIADAASKNASTRATSQEGAGQPTWSPDAIRVAAQAVANGVPLSRVAPGLSAKNSNRDAIMNEAVTLNPDLDLAAAESGFTGQQQEARTAGGIGGRIAFAANSLDQSLPLLKTAAANVDLSNFPNVNFLENYVRQHNGENTAAQKNLEQLMVAIQTTVSDYSSLIARNGVPTDATRAQAVDLLNKNMSKGQIQGFIDQVQKEKEAQLKAKQATTGRGSAKTGTATGGVEDRAPDSPLTPEELEEYNRLKAQ